MAKEQKKDEIGGKKATQASVACLNPFLLNAFSEVPQYIFDFFFNLNDYE